ncbi:MAG: hypothetical protein WC422_01130 [Candidatus Paceibacterota bacterium]|jgi:hypothetical protein
MDCLSKTTTAQANVDIKPKNSITNEIFKTLIRYASEHAPAYPISNVSNKSYGTGNN